MKISVAQILHYRKAIDILSRFVHDFATKSAPGSKEREESAALVASVNSLEKLVADLMGCEVTVKG